MSGIDAIGLVIACASGGAIGGIWWMWERLGGVALRAKAYEESHERLLRTICTLDMATRHEIRRRLVDIYEMDTGRDLGASP